MAKVTIGGRNYDLPKLKFKQLKMIAPTMGSVVTNMKAGRDNKDPVGGMSNTFAAVDDALKIIAASYLRDNPKRKLDNGDEEAMDLAKWTAFFEEELEPTEVAGLTKAIWDVMNETGLVKLGEFSPAAVAALPGADLTGTMTI